MCSSGQRGGRRGGRHRRRGGGRRWWRRLGAAGTGTVVVGTKDGVFRAGMTHTLNAMQHAARTTSGEKHGALKR